MEELYKRVEIKDGNSTEPVNYVGVYTLNWNDRPAIPEWGFTEVTLPDLIKERVSEDEIEKMADEYLKSVGTIRYIKECKHDFIEGFKAAIKLLTE